MWDQMILPPVLPVVTVWKWSVNLCIYTSTARSCFWQAYRSREDSQCLNIGLFITHENHHQYISWLYMKLSVQKWSYQTQNPYRWGQDGQNNFFSGLWEFLLHRAFTISKKKNDMKWPKIKTWPVDTVCSHSHSLRGGLRHLMTPSKSNSNLKHWLAISIFQFPFKHLFSLSSTHFQDHLTVVLFYLPPPLSHHVQASLAFENHQALKSKSHPPACEHHGVTSSFSQKHSVKHQ